LCTASFLHGTQGCPDSITPNHLFTPGSFDSIVILHKRNLPGKVFFADIADIMWKSVVSHDKMYAKWEGGTVPLSRNTEEDAF